MAIDRILIERRREILARWRLRVGKKLAGGALDRAALEDGWAAFERRDGGGELSAGADWWIVRGAVAANGGTVHARSLPGVGCLVTIDVRGSGDEEPCCATGT